MEMGPAHRQRFGTQMTKCVNNPITIVTFRHQIVNTGDMLKFLTGGYYKSTIHRVFRPPEDQRDYDRLTIIYYAMPNGNVRLLPLVDSPVLQRVGIERQRPDEEAPLAEAWRRGKTAIYGRTPLLKKGKEHNVEEEVIEGFVVKYYN